MRAKEFISESGITGSILPDVQRTLPATYVIPELQNNDFYMQYRFGVALAGAKGKEQRQKDNVPPYSRESSWGENEVIVSFAGDSVDEKFINDALKDIGLSAKAKKQVTTTKSEEPISTQKNSLVKPFKGFEL
jgi:hypothetical protein